MAARSLQPYRLPWRQPPTTASGVPADRAGWLVRLSDGEHAGVGDAAPWESWGTESAAACEAARCLSGGPVAVAAVQRRIKPIVVVAYGLNSEHQTSQATSSNRMSPPGCERDCSCTRCSGGG